MVIYNNTFQAKASKAHKKAFRCLKKEYPAWTIWQEKQINIDGKTLFADIYIQSPFQMIIEIQGKQHHKFVPHFHKTEAGFKKAQENDKIKKEFCEMNDILYLAIDGDNFDEDDFLNEMNKKIQEGIEDDI